MYKNWLLIVLLAVLAWGVYLSDEFVAIAGGVAIFLFGMMFLEDGFSAFSGGVLERLLQRSTGNLWKSHLFGLVTTSLVQSSSLVSVITISFLSAGLIGLSAGIGIIFGANLGTTTGAWLMAGLGMKVNISAYAMPMIIFGLLLVFQKKRSFKGMGQVLAGLGFLFLGIHYMKEGFEAYKETIDLSAYAVSGYPGLFLFAAIGIVATIIMQSSHATLMLIIAALASGQITYENALALAIGANIGTTITAILGSIGANIAGKRLAVAHLVFNSVTAIIAIILITPFRLAVDWSADLIGIAPADWTMKLAVFHTLFNLVGVMVMVPFIPKLVRMLERRVTTGSLNRQARAAGLKPRYLNEAALLLPDTAREVVINETANLFDHAFEIMAHGLNLHRMDILMGRNLDEIVANSRELMDIDVEERYHEGVKQLYSDILEFISRALSIASLTDIQRDQLLGLREACRNIVQILKEISLMRDNLERFMASDNQEIRQQYNRMRSTLASILRRTFRIRDSRDEVLIFVTIKEMEEDLGACDVLADGTFDRLVRGHLITPAMASSLMNDNALATKIGRRLVTVCKKLFVAQGTDPLAVERTVLDEETSLADH